MKHRLAAPLSVVSLLLMSCGGSSSPAAQPPATSPNPAPAASDAPAAPTASAASSVRDSKPAEESAVSASGTGTVLGQPFRPQSAYARHNAASGNDPAKVKVIVMVYDGALPDCAAEDGMGRMRHARLSFASDWREGSTATNASAGEKDAAGARVLNSKKTGKIEATLTGVEKDKARLKFSIKDPDTKTEIVSEIDVKRCN